VSVVDGETVAAGTSKDQSQYAKEPHKKPQSTVAAESA
tara:strand:+ start:667 stop:780 length:114 start_codon:yes stop_codon:yes gene_type:complete